MKKNYKIMWLLPLMLVISCSTSKNINHEEAGPKYFDKKETLSSLSPFTLGPGDEIKIQVWRNDDLNRTVQIDPSGNISLPLAGKIHAAGLSIPQLSEEITVRLSKYIVNPQIDISISDLHSQKVHILGEVNNPGTFPLNQSMLIYEAIARAGGFTSDANEDNVLLVKTDDGIARVTALDISGFYEEGQITQNIYLKNGDIIYVPSTSIADVERFMIRLTHIIQPVTEALRGVVLGADAVQVIEGEYRAVVTP